MNVVPAPIKLLRPITHICKQVFCAIMVFSITAVRYNEQRKGKKQLSATVLIFNTQPASILTLSPIVQLSIMTPAPIEQLSPISAGPVIMADEGSVFVREENNSTMRPFIGQAVKGVSYSNPETVTQGYTTWLPLELELEK